MKRLGRGLLNGITVLSLLLLIATVVLWIRGYWRIDLVGCESAVRPGRAHRGGNASASDGQIAVEIWERWDPKEAPAPASGFEHTSRTTIPGLADARRKYAASLADLSGGVHALGFSFSRTEMDPEPFYSANPGAPPRVPATQTVWNLLVPCWQLALLFSILPLIRLPRAVRRRRIRGRLSRNQCVNCGYDLRESPERCPECGAIR